MENIRISESAIERKGAAMELETVVHCSPLQQDTSPPLSAPRKQGGWRSIKYILGNESFEKLASMSLISNITVYLSTKYNLSGIFVVNVVNIWSGSSNFASLAGAFVADTYLGRFRTLLFGSISSFLGMGTIALTAALHQLRPSSCGSDKSNHCPQPLPWQLGVLFSGLGLLSIGAGGIRPCNIAFGADQFDARTEKGRAQLESFFNWWYFSFTIALIIALTAVVYIQTNISWALGFAIPTICLLFSISIFLLGRHTYILAEPKGSIFLDMAKVITAACRKQRYSVSNYSFYDPPMADSSDGEKLAHTDRFRCLDKAAIIINPVHELDGQGKAKSQWSLCSLQKVEELKCLIAIIPVWVTGIGCFIAYDQQNTFGVLQAMQMNRSIGTHFKFPPGWMNMASMLALIIWILIYQRGFIRWAKEITGKEKRLTMKQRIGIGIIISILCMLVAGFVEKRRRDSALQHGSFISPKSFAFLLPQYTLSGLTEALAAVAIMEFFTMQMPESMRTVAGAVFFLTLSLASYLGSLIVNITHGVTMKYAKSPWLGGHDLNQNRLDYYYFLIAILGALNFVYFIFFASRYLSSYSKSTSLKQQLRLEHSKGHDQCIDMPEKEPKDAER